MYNNLLSTYYVRAVDTNGKNQFGILCDGGVLSLLMRNALVPCDPPSEFEFRFKNDLSKYIDVCGEYIVTPPKLFQKGRIADIFSNKCIDINYSKYIHAIDTETISYPLGLSYLGYYKNETHGLYEHDIVSPRGLDGDLIGIIKEDYYQSGHPFRVLLRPNPKYADWPKWIDLNDFAWDIIGDVWQNRELLGDWDWHMAWLEEYDPFAL